MPISKTYDRRMSSREHGIEQRRARVSELHIECWTLEEIAEEVGVSVATVRKDVEAMRRRWREQQSLLTLEEEVARTFDVERKAREAWQRSCEDAETRTRKTEWAPAPADSAKPRAVQFGDAVVLSTLFSPDGEEAQEVETSGGLVEKIQELPTRSNDLVPVKEIRERKRTGQCGNPAFLDRIAWAVETRLKLLGAFKDGGVNFSVNMIAPEQMMAFSNAFLAAAKEVVGDAYLLEQLQERTLQLLPGGPVIVEQAAEADDGTRAAEVDAGVEASAATEDEPLAEDEV
jgi:hypothetical protein